MGRMTANTKIFQLKIQLRNIRPPVWRRLLVPGEVTLGELHELIQSSMGWTNSHLHEFETAGVRYGVPNREWGDDDTKDESRVKLFRVAVEGSRLRYTYDFGDGWEHDLMVEKVLSPQSGVRYPGCTGGRRACPPEDVGGPWGYEDFLRSLNDPQDAEHASWVEWIGGAFDPDEFDAVRVDKVLDAYAWVDAPTKVVRQG
jgi:hypothetical protein